MDKKIFEEKESIRMAMEEWKTLESKNNSLEKDILSHRDQIARQRNRQLEVKKNEEYQALEHEIANLESKIDELESEQIETLDKIDDARETAEVAEKKIAQRVIELEKEREERVAFGKQAEIDVQSLETQIVETREEVEPDFLSVYDRVSKIGTANFDNRSFRLNFEISTIVVDEAFAAEVEAMLEADFAHSTQIDPDEFAQRGLFFQFSSRVARLFAPIL